MLKIDRTMPSGFFITATDTGIGKTFVSRLLIQTFMKITPVTYFKPVQTGCFASEEGELISPDFQFILESGLQLSAEYSTHVPFRFKAACSPHLASRLENQDISIVHITDCYNKLKGDKGCSRLVVVEGAGGIYAPLRNDLFMIDLMTSLNLPIIVVVSQKLGTINHTLLSINALQKRSLRLAAIVMNNADGAQDDFIHKDNKEFIRKAVYPTPFINVNFNAAPSESMEAFCRELIR
jgi:dethiobiotin synthetase